MTDPFGRLRRFLRELKRRNVYKVAVTYLVAAFVALQTADLLVPETTLPAGSETFVIYVAIFGFPVALVLAWAFEMTPKGVQRTPDAETSEPAPGGAGGWVAALVVVVVAGGGFWYLTAGGGEEATTEATATTDTVTRTAVRRDTAGPPRIAVLPFENIARDTGDAFFARGMHEEVLNQLSKVSGLGVLSRTTMMEYEDADMTAVEIGRELDVKAILEGTVRRAGDQVRITTQLIDAQRGTHLWSNTYDRRLSVEAIFDIQADIAEQIAGALESQLAEGERQRIESAPTRNQAAYDAYLEGRSHFLTWLGRREPEDLNRAIERLREATNRDSTFAEAHAWLGRAYHRRAATSDELRWVDSARARIERAKALDPELAEAYVAEGLLASSPVTDMGPSARIRAFRRALKLQPSHAVARAELAEALHSQGRYAEAIRVAREAVQLDPRRPQVLDEMSDALRVAGFYDAAEAWARRALEIEPGYVAAIDGLALTQLQRGRPEQAHQTWEKFLKGTNAPPPIALERAAWAALATGRPEQAKMYLERIPKARRQRTAEPTESEPRRLRTWNRYRLGLAELRLGNRERGRELLRQAVDSTRAFLAEQEASGETGVGFYIAQRNLAKTLAALGQREEALQILEESVSALPWEVELVFHSPFFDSLRSDPRFQKIVRVVEARRERIREEVRQLDIDLYPPGAEPDSAGQAESAVR